MRVIIAWSAEAAEQYARLNTPEQESARRVQAAIQQSPRAGHVYQKVLDEATGRYTTVWVAWGLQVRVLYTLDGDRRGIIAYIEDVAPSDLPGITEYEERTRP